MSKLSRPRDINTPIGNIFTQGHLPMVHIYFMGGPLDGQTKDAVRDRVSEGHEIDILGCMYRVTWRNLRWEADFVAKTAFNPNEMEEEKSIGGVPVLVDKNGFVYPGEDD